MAGLQVINDTGHIVIDQNYRNFGKVSVLPVFCGTAVGSVYAGTFTAPKVAFVTLTSDKACVFMIAESGDSCTYRIIVQGSARNVTVHIYAPIDVTASSLGLQVFDASSKLIFDAMFPFAKVIDYLIGPDTGAWPTTPFTKTYHGVSKIGVAVCTGLFFATDMVWDNNPNQHDYWETAGFVEISNSNTVTFTESDVFGITYFGAQQYDEIYSGTPRYLILDISND